MNSETSTKEFSYVDIIAKAWPIILANASVPLLGLADTAIIGHIGSTQSLGALALGSLVFSFLYWSFGFLRMATTGFVAQADGQKNEKEVRASLLRALILAAIFGLALIALQTHLNLAAFFILDASSEIERLAQNYFEVRIWGAPATLISFALFGFLIGLGQTRTLLALQILLNGSNIVLDYFFAAYLDLGVKGIALGTVIAEWGVCLCAIFIIYRTVKIRKKKANDLSNFIPTENIRKISKLFNTLQANADIMVRTLFLLGSFIWFNNKSAALGDNILAANHILLQLISFSAFFLDGFAFVVESYVGKAIGAKNKTMFTSIVKKTTVLAAGTALILSLFILLFGSLAIDVLTNIQIVKQTALGFLSLSALYVFLAFPAFQLDGIFIGALQGKAMRNASVISTLTFITVAWPLSKYWDNLGLWIGFIIYVCARAITLLCYLPTVFASFNDSKMKQL